MATPKPCVTCDTKIEYVKDKTQCLKCHLKQKQTYTIRKSYRGEPQTFEKLEEEMGGQLIKILNGKFAILTFHTDIGMNKKRSKPKKFFTFDEFHTHQDENFFGDRPGIYLLEEDDDECVKVGETYNLSQRLHRHKTNIKKPCNGLFIFCCKKGFLRNKWPSDEMNNRNFRLTIERILQANFKQRLNTTENWVTPSKRELKLAEEICEELHKNKDKWEWLHWKYGTLVFPAVWKI